MYTYGNGFDITCTEFEGDYDRKVTVWELYDLRLNGEIETCDPKIADIHAETISPIFASSPIYTVNNMVTFAFYATSAENCRAYGVITHH